jgi:hypothetical protein
MGVEFSAVTRRSYDVSPPILKAFEIFGRYGVRTAFRSNAGSVAAWGDGRRIEHLQVHIQDVLIGPGCGSFRLLSLERLGRKIRIAPKILLRLHLMAKALEKASRDDLWTREVRGVGTIVRGAR